MCVTSGIMHSQKGTNNYHLCYRNLSCLHSFRICLLPLQSQSSSCSEVFSGCRLCYKFVHDACNSGSFNAPSPVILERILGHLVASLVKQPEVGNIIRNKVYYRTLLIISNVFYTCGLLRLQEYLSTCI